MGGKGNILVMMGDLSNQAARQRTKDIHDVIASPNAPASRSSKSRPATGIRTQGTDLMTNWISSGLQFDAVVSNNDEMAIGAIQALKAAGFDMNKVIVGRRRRDAGRACRHEGRRPRRHRVPERGGAGLRRGRHRAEARQGRERRIHGLGSVRTGHARQIWNSISPRTDPARSSRGAQCGASRDGFRIEQGARHEQRSSRACGPERRRGGQLRTIFCRSRACARNFRAWWRWTMSSSA